MSVSAVCFKIAHPSWHFILEEALSCMDSKYLIELQQKTSCLPTFDKLFAAFSKNIDEVKYILLGESPYPRAESANGYAFWDAAVRELWSENGLSKAVNRATSLRNFMKMLLVAKGSLSEPYTQLAIAQINKSTYINTGDELFTNMLNRGFLLLNISLIYEKGCVAYHARNWRPFISCVLRHLSSKNQIVKCLVLGKLAQNVPESVDFERLVAEHPYNISFITNPSVVAFFKPMDLLGYELL